MLKSKIFLFAYMQPPHVGHDLSLKVLEFLRDWELTWLWVVCFRSTLFFV